MKRKNKCIRKIIIENSLDLYRLISKDQAFFIWIYMFCYAEFDIYVTIIALIVNVFNNGINVWKVGYIDYYRILWYSNYRNNSRFAEPTKTALIVGL